MYLKILNNKLIINYYQLLTNQFKRLQQLKFINEISN